MTLVGRVEDEQMAAKTRAAQQARTGLFLTAVSARAGAHLPALFQGGPGLAPVLLRSHWGVLRRGVHVPGALCLLSGLLGSEGLAWQPRPSGERGWDVCVA